MIGYKENPMLYIFLGVAVLTNYFLREMINLTFYMVLDKPVYVCTSSAFLGVMSLIVLLIQKRSKRCIVLFVMERIIERLGGLFRKLWHLD